MKIFERICASVIVVAFAALGAGCAQTQTASCDFREARADAKPVLIGLSSGGQPASTPIVASRVDVAVTAEDGPVVLILSSFHPIEWRLAILPGAELSGVYLSGPSGSQVYGAPRDAKLIRNRAGDANVACSVAKIPPMTYSPARSSRQAASEARRVVAALMPQTQAQAIETVRDNALRLTVNQRPWPVAADALADAAGPPHDPSFVRIGQWGLMQLAMRGDIELLRGDDLVEAWRIGATAMGVPSAEMLKTRDTFSAPRPMWVVRRPFTLPRELFSTTFVVPAGVEPPRGAVGDGLVLFMDGFRCAGRFCPPARRTTIDAAAPDERLGAPAAGYRDPTPTDYRALDGRSGDAEYFGLGELVRRRTGS